MNHPFHGARPGLLGSQQQLGDFRYEGEMEQRVGERAKAGVKNTKGQPQVSVAKGVSQFTVCFSPRFCPVSFYCLYRPFCMAELGQSWQPDG